DRSESPRAERPGSRRISRTGLPREHRSGSIPARWVRPGSRSSRGPSCGRSISPSVYGRGAGEVPNAPGAPVGQSFFTPLRRLRGREDIVGTGQRATVRQHGGLRQRPAPPSARLTSKVFLFLILFFLSVLVQVFALVQIFKVFVVEILEIFVIEVVIVILEVLFELFVEVVIVFEVLIFVLVVLVFVLDVFFLVGPARIRRRDVGRGAVKRQPPGRFLLFVQPGADPCCATEHECVLSYGRQK